MPNSYTNLGGLGEFSSVTLAGPPDNITASALNSFKNSSVTFWNGWISQ